MGTSAQEFRGAFMGGFNRQDVLNYIESAAKTATQREEKLKQELNALRGEKETAERSAQMEGERADRAEARLGEVSAKLAETESAFVAAREALEGKRMEVRRLADELNRLQDKSSRMESGAAAYAELRDRTGTIELEAHQRALLIQQAAEARAKEIETEGEENARRMRAGAEQLIGQVRSEYVRLRQGLDNAAGAAAQELGRVGQTLEEVKAEFSAHDEAFEKLLDSCRREPQAQRKEPRPLPLTSEE